MKKQPALLTRVTTGAIACLAAGLLSGCCETAATCQPVVPCAPAPIVEVYYPPVVEVASPLPPPKPTCPVGQPLEEYFADPEGQHQQGKLICSQPGAPIAAAPLPVAATRDSIELPPEFSTGTPLTDADMIPASMLRKTAPAPAKKEAVKKAAPGKDTAKAPKKNGKKKDAAKKSAPKKDKTTDDARNTPSKL